jgi:hypothetical protein
MAGFRYFDDGSLGYVGTYGSYCCSTVDSSYSRYLDFYSSFADMLTDYRAYGSSVRCLKD